MTDSDALNVWYDDQRVGRLWRNATNQIGFRYSQTWLENSGFAISVSLPLTPEPYEPQDALAHRYFANLLPEGRVRELVVRDLKIPDSDFDLLRAIGGECAGALSVLQEDRKPSETMSYRELTATALQDLILRKGQIYSRHDAAQEVPRLSLAGAQEKCPVLLRDGRFYLSRGEAASSHILKFAVPDYRHVPAYETVLTDLARRIDLHACTVEFQILRVNDHAHDYLLIERYDRLMSKTGEVQRLHQEDFCQALGLGRERKYEEDGGIDFADCYSLLQQVSSEPALDAEQLLRWQIFNYLAGNSDGHAKNLSLLHQVDGTVRLAPLYDLVCTRAIERIDQRLAFAVDTERMPGNIRPLHWQRLAVTLSIRPKYLHTLVTETAERIRDAIQPVVEAFQQRHGEYRALQRVVRVVERQCRQALRD